MQELQKTLGGTYSFEGKGLHSGLKVQMTIRPSEENTGIRFLRTDIGKDAFIEANVDYVTHTQRGTTLENNGARVSTIEHVLSALWALGVDNAIIELDNYEVPILDGSALPYVNAITKDSLVEQKALRKVYNIEETIQYKDEQSGSELIISPADDYSIDVTIDFNSKVLGVQKFHFDSSIDYVTQIAPCRTFVFLHEIEFLFNNNLIKGGDLENAIVIAEKPVPQETLDKMAKLFNVEKLEKVPSGYLNNLQLHFPDECVRHKLLDIIGDFALIGIRINGKVFANKSGHKINTSMAKLIRQKALNKI